MESLIARLDEWLRQHRPAYYAFLQPCLTDSELANLEKELGLELPSDFKLFYQWKNGTPAEGFDTILPNFRWLSIEDVILYWNESEKWVVDTPKWWRHHGWLCFLTDDTAVEICLDMNGSFNGKVGQILLVRSDDIYTLRTILHENFAKWLETLVEALERGIFTGDEDNDAPLDTASYKKLFEDLNPGYPIENETPLAGPYQRWNDI
jgi:cell wall assembly regulator SMI1